MGVLAEVEVRWYRVNWVWKECGWWRTRRRRERNVPGVGALQRCWRRWRWGRRKW